MNDPEKLLSALSYLKTLGADDFGASTDAHNKDAPPLKPTAEVLGEVADLVNRHLLEMLRAGQLNASQVDALLAFHESEAGLFYAAGLESTNPVTLAHSYKQQKPEKVNLNLSTDISSLGSSGWVDSQGAASFNTKACNFCGNSPADCRKLVAGPNVFICEHCILTCCEILKEQGQLL